MPIEGGGAGCGVCLSSHVDDLDLLAPHGCALAAHLPMGSWRIRLCRSDPEYPPRVEGDHLVWSGSAPVDDLDVAACRAFLGGVAARQPVDRHDARAVLWSGLPVEHGVSRPQGPWFADGDAQLDEGHQSPMSPFPFAMRMDTEPSVRALTGEQRPHDRTVEDLVGVDNVLAEQVPSAQHADSGFL